MWATVGKQASFLIPLPSIGSGPGPYCPCTPPWCLPLFAWHDICICLVLFPHLQSTQTTNKSTYIFVCILVSLSVSLALSLSLWCLLLSLSLLCLLLRLVLCFRVALLFARFEPLNWLSAVFLRMSVGGQFKSWLSWTALTMTMATQRQWQRQNPLTS